MDYQGIGIFLALALMMGGIIYTFTSRATAPKTAPALEIKEE
tara:strand:- start:406 stop:531 length:126 start_codon:yes stop_codon:yes gene_type:complete